MRLQPRYDAGIGQRRGIAEDAAFGNVAQQAAHDFGAARLGKLVDEEDLIGTGDGADLPYHVLLEFVFQGFARGDAFLRT